MKSISPTQAKLLVPFFENPTKEFYEKEAARKAQVSIGAANKHLPLLVKEGYLKQEKRGRMKFYAFSGTPEAKRLKVDYSLASRLARGLGRLGKDLEARVYLYGSVARGEDTESSDWDVLIIGNVDRTSVEERLAALRKRYGRNVKATVVTSREWLAMKSEDPAFYESVERDRIELI